MLHMKKKLLSIVSILLSVLLFSSPAMVYAADSQALTKEEILSMDQSELLSFLQEEGLVLPEDYDVHITEMSEPFVYEYTPLILQGKIDSSVRRFNYEPSNQMLFRLYAVLDRLGLAENQSAVPMDSYTLQDSTPIGSWSNNYLNYNCYAYALGSTAWVQPGDYSGEPFALTMPVSDMADVVLADLEALGYWGYTSSTKPAALLDPYFKVIAIRKAVTNRDYHFMKMYGSLNAWAHKPGQTQPLKWNDSSPDSKNWTNERMTASGAQPPEITYDSNIYYILYKSTKDPGIQPKAGEEEGLQALSNGFAQRHFCPVRRLEKAPPERKDLGHDEKTPDSLSGTLRSIFSGSLGFPVL